MAAKHRLDAEMTRRGMVESREKARRLIIEGKVLVAGSFADKPARLVDTAQPITIQAEGPAYVSRAGHKLAAALEEFSLNPAGLRCLDVGSSTGGFSDCLLQAGASKITAVDVGTNQLHERLRMDERITVFEQTDIRSLAANEAPKPFELIVVDVSFISLKQVLPAVLALAQPLASILLLVKPQFEAGYRESSKGRGVISDPVIWIRVLNEVIDCAEELGAGLLQIAPSALVGSKGNVEFVANLTLGGSSMPSSRRKEMIEFAVTRVLS